MKTIKAIKLFLSIVFRDFHGVRIGIRAAYNVVMIVHYDKFEYDNPNEL